MDVYVRTKPAGSLVTCPFSGCGKPVLNTPRYIPLTRLKKNQQNELLAKERGHQKQKHKKGSQNTPDSIAHKPGMACGMALLRNCLVFFKLDSTNIALGVQTNVYSNGKVFLHAIK